MVKENFAKHHAKYGPFLNGEVLQDVSKNVPKHGFGRPRQTGTLDSSLKEGVVLMCDFSNSRRWKSRKCDEYPKNIKFD